MSKIQKATIKEIIDQVPKGYYVDSIDIQNISGEIIVSGRYKPKYETRVTEAQWGFGKTEPAPIQINDDFCKLEDEGRRIEVQHYSNENIADDEGKLASETSSAVYRIYGGN